MTRVRRWVFNLLTGASLALAFAVAILWTRSYFGFHDQIVYASEVAANEFQWDISICSRPGYLEAWYDRSFSVWHATPGWFTSFRLYTDPVPPITDAERPWPMGLRYERTDGMMPGNGFGSVPSPYTSWNLKLSYPLLLVIFALAPTFWTYRWNRQRRRLNSGKCLACGYDLRATPERCPECGTIRRQSSVSSFNRRRI